MTEQELRQQIVAVAQAIDRAGFCPSKSGNVSARDLCAEGLLDILSSDYVPFSLMQAVFALEDTITLPEAVAMVTRRPAEAAGFAVRCRQDLGGRDRALLLTRA